MLTESRRGDFRMLGRLEEEWTNGVNRFDRRGEVLFGAFAADSLAGIGGRNIDPFAGDPTIGRVRHLYVTENMRGYGIGRLLIEQILSDAALYFTRLNLGAPVTAFGFYEHLGFVRVAGSETATHCMPLCA